MESLTSPIMEIVRTNAGLAPPIVFALAFGESLAFVSLLLPATVILIAVGGLVSAAGMEFWAIWVAAALGAALGDWVSYWFGFRYKEAIGGTWPLSRHPGLLARGHRLFERWGAVGVFGGRFFGPLRCVMPLVAGVCAMPQIIFQFVNVTSALLWATVVLAPGWFTVQWFQ